MTNTRVREIACSACGLKRVVLDRRAGEAYCWGQPGSPCAKSWEQDESVLLSAMVDARTEGYREGIEAAAAKMRKIYDTSCTYGHQLGCSCHEDDNSDCDCILSVMGARWTKYLDKGGEE